MWSQLFDASRGADSMGAMGGDRPKAKKLWGNARKSPPQEFCYVAIVHSQKVGLQ